MLVNYHPERQCDVAQRNVYSCSEVEKESSTYLSQLAHKIDNATLCKARHATKSHDLQVLQVGEMREHCVGDPIASDKQIFQLGQLLS